jgi:hypothetical protein
MRMWKMRNAMVILITASMFAYGPSVPGGGKKDAPQEQVMDSPVSPVPKSWPARWGERKLYRHEHAFVYAQQKSTADDVVKMLRMVVESARQDGVTEPALGLIVVIDIKEKFPIEIAKLEEILNDPNASMAGEKSKEILNMIKEARKISDRAGTDMNSLVSMIPIPLKPAVLIETAKEFPEGADRETAWCIIVPTDRYVRAAMRAAMEGMVKIDKMNWKERLLIGALTPVAQHVAGKEIRKTAQADLYQLLVEGQKYLSEESKKAKVDTYRLKLGLDGQSKPKADRDHTRVEQEGGSGSSRQKKIQ